MTPGWDGRRTRGWVAAGTAVILALAGVALLPGESGARSWAARASYDALYHFAPFAPARPGDAPVVLVYLDRESYLREGQNPDAPWDRRLHASLVRRLTASGARAVVFDIVFDHAGADAEADRDFAEAIRENGRVVLAAELNGWQRDAGESVRVASVSPVLPYAPLATASAAWGLASLQMDEDFTVRRYFPGFGAGEFPSLTESAVRVAGLRAEDAPRAPPDLWLRYQGPPLALPHIGYSAALRPGEAPDRLFHDRVVVVGARPMVSGFTERRDEFRNPWPESGHGVASMPAVEVHATQIVNRLGRGFLSRPPPAVERVAVMGAAALFCALLFPLRPAAAAGVAAGLEVLWIGGVAVLFLRFQAWFPWLIVAAVQIPGALAGSVLFHSVDWYRQRRRLEAATRRADALIREQAALLDKAQDAILVQQFEGAVTYVNPAAERLTGWTRQDWLQGAAASSVFRPCLGRLHEARQACDAGGEWIGELDWALRDGALRTLQSRWTLIRDPSGRPVSRLLINTDITEKKRLEAQFLRAQRLDTIGSLAGGMAHDLNSALAPVLMGIQLLKRDTQDAESLRMLEVMERNTHRGADMVRQVLLFSRGVSESPAAVRPGPMLAELEELLRHSFPRSITIRTMAPEDLWPVLVNPTQLHQVLLNLCVNARDAMPGGGELTLAADNVRLGADAAAAIPGGRPGEFVMLLVGDTGEGIPPEILPRLFEPFVTTKPPGRGTGLGLSTAARIVVAHGGFLAVENTPGEGAIFEVYLPRASPARSGELPSSGPAPAPCGHGESVVILDRDRAVGSLLAEALSAQGYAAVPVDSLAALRELPPSRSPVAAVLVDAGLPGAEGAAGATLIRQAFPEAVVLWMLPEEAPASPDSGTVLRKPLGMSLLMERLSLALRPPAT